MLHTIFKIALMCIVCMCAACNGHSSYDPKGINESTIIPISTQVTFTTKKFIEDISALKMNGAVDSICINMNSFALWVPGDFAETVDIIRQTLVAKIDSLKVKTSVSQMATLASMKDDNGNVIGLIGGTIQVCLSATNLSQGIHNGEIKFKNKDNKEFEYTFTFDLE